MSYDKDFNIKLKLFTTDLTEAVNAYPGHTALEVATMLWQRRHLSNKDYFEVAHLGLDRAIAEGARITELNYIHNLGFHHYKLGDFIEAKMYYAQGLYISESINNKDFVARFQNRLGEINTRKVNYEKALDYYFKVLRLEEDKYCFEAYSNLADLYQKKEDYDTAIEYAEKGYTYNRKKGNYENLTLDLITVGNVNFSKGRYPQALGFYARALKVTDIYRQPYRRCIAVFSSGDVLFELGHHKEAKATYEYAHEIAEQYGFKYLFAVCKHKISQTQSEQKEHKEALKTNEEALKIIRENGYDLLELKALRKRVDYHEALKQEEKANKVLRKVENLRIVLTEKEQLEKLSEYIEEKEKELEYFKAQTRSMASANRDLHQYAKIIAHDLKEPLRTIGSFTTLLKRKYGDTSEDEVEDYFKFIMEGTHRMGDLLDDLLNYVALGIQDSPPTKVNLNQIIEQVMESLESLIKEKKAKVNFDKLPTILGQKSQLRSLFYHLIANGIKFNDNDQPEVTLNVNREDMNYLFRISDNGIGVHEDYHNKIFLLFHKLNRKDNTGTGMGLSMSKKIVELHGGSMWINSDKGAGTVVEFTLPDI